MSDTDNQRESRARFTHAFSSPLTAMRGAIDLLRHPRRMGSDQLSRDLLDTLERNYHRLSAAVDILLHHTRTGESTIEISLPFGTFDSPNQQDTALPTHADPTPAEAASDPLGAEPLAADLPGVIVLISDNAQRREIVQAMLQAASYYVLSAVNGASGIDLARQRRPDLIVVDYQLAAPGARQVAKILRDDPDTKTVPQIFVGDQAHPSDPQFHQTEVLPVGQETESLVVVVAKRIDTARASATHAPTLLLVDDDTDIQRIVMLRLQQDGYRVVQAMNGTEALIAAQKQAFDLIILDLLLPDIDGFSVLGALRARTATATTPILLLSARDSAPEKVRGFQLGADDYVTKPFSPAELQARVRAALRRYEREAGANPSTRLPGNIAIEQTLRRRIDQNVPFAVCYADLDNFKAYNDTYSFLKGDAIIQQTAHVLTEAVEQAGNADDFVGHIGGDDFVVITSPPCAEKIAGLAIAQFDQLSPLFYDPETRRRGYIDAHDRQGRPVRYPFVSLSIGIVSSERHAITHVAEVAQRSVEPKKRAKELPGSVYVIED